MLYLCRRTLFATVLFVMSDIVLAGFWQESISLEQWDSFGQGRDLHRMDSVRELLTLFQENNGYQLTIRHPGGESGTDWGETLRQWLVALGIPSKYIVTSPGSGGLDILHISLSYPDQ